MTDKLTPVRCGCGGEAKVISYLSREYCKMAYYVRCVECGTETDDLHSEAEAITVWNRAMSAKDINVPNKFATDTNVGDKEQKKGEWQRRKGSDWWKCSECGHVIFSETERDRREFHAFCGRCGADMRGE